MRKFSPDSHKQKSQSHNQLLQTFAHCLTYVADSAAVLLLSFPLSSCLASSYSLCLPRPSAKNPYPPQGPSPVLVDNCPEAQMPELSCCARLYL